MERLQDSKKNMTSVHKNGFEWDLYDLYIYTHSTRTYHIISKDWTTMYIKNTTNF